MLSAPNGGRLATPPPKSRSPSEHVAHWMARTPAEYRRAVGARNHSPAAAAAATLSPSRSLPSLTPSPIKSTAPSAHSPVAGRPNLAASSASAATDDEKRLQKRADASIRTVEARVERLRLSHLALRAAREKQEREVSALRGEMTYDAEVQHSVREERCALEERLSRLTLRWEETERELDDAELTGRRLAMMRERLALSIRHVPRVTTELRSRLERATARANELGAHPVRAEGERRALLQQAEDVKRLADGERNRHTRRANRLKTAIRLKAELRGLIVESIDDEETMIRKARDEVAQEYARLEHKRAGIFMRKSVVRAKLALSEERVATLMRATHAESLAELASWHEPAAPGNTTGSGAKVRRGAEDLGSLENAARPALLKSGSSCTGVLLKQRALKATVSNLQAEVEKRSSIADEKRELLSKLRDELKRLHYVGDSIEASDSAYVLFNDEGEVLQAGGSNDIVHLGEKVMKRQVEVRQLAAKLSKLDALVASAGACIDAILRATFTADLGRNLMPVARSAKPEPSVPSPKPRGSHASTPQQHKPFARASWQPSPSELPSISQQPSTVQPLRRARSSVSSAEAATEVAAPATKVGPGGLTVSTGTSLSAPRLSKRGATRPSRTPEGAYVAGVYQPSVASPIATRKGFASAKGSRLASWPDPATRAQVMASGTKEETTALGADVEHGAKLESALSMVARRLVLGMVAYQAEARGVFVERTALDRAIPLIDAAFDTRPTLADGAALNATHEGEVQADREHAFQKIAFGSAVEHAVRTLNAAEDYTSCLARALTGSSVGEPEGEQPLTSSILRQQLNSQKRRGPDHARSSSRTLL